MLIRKRRSWPLRVAIVAAIVFPSFFVGHVAQAAKYDLCVIQEDTWLLGIKIQRLCIPLNI